MSKVTGLFLILAALLIILSLEGCFPIIPAVLR